MKRMIVHCEPGSTEMVLFEDDKLVEYAAERSQKKRTGRQFLMEEL